MSGGLRDAVAELQAQWRLDFRAAERVLAALDAGGGVSELVEATGVDRHDVEDVLRRVEPWLRRDGGRYVRIAGVDGWPEPARAVDEAVLTGTLAELAAGLPPSVWSLDHVSARPATMAARARYLAERYALAGATVLCVGDHDLTSVAVALVEPAAEVLVVDVDQRILAYIGRVAAERGLAITTAFADLRLGLPASFAGRADLVFTDPPYTTDGVELFLARGLAGLRRSGHERVAFAYGFAGRQLARGFRTQAVLHELRLVIEAVLPGFNRFHGAEAIGGVSDLYVCRPSRWTWPVLERAPAGTASRIYTRGGAAAEGADPVLDQSTVDTVTRALGTRPAAFVGPGWPPDLPGARPAADLADFLSARTALSAPVAVNLQPHFGASLPAALLAAVRAEAAAVVVPEPAVRHLTRPLRTLLDPVGTVEVRDGPAGAAVVLVRRRSDVDGGPTAGGPAAEVLRFLVEHPDAKVGNAWRDGVIAAAARRGRTLTKNAARALVGAGAVPPTALQLRLADLPLDVLGLLVDAVPATAAAAAAAAAEPAHPD